MEQFGQALSILQNALNSNAILNNIKLKPQNQTMSKMLPMKEPLWKLAGKTGPFIQIAAVSGALAVILGAYNGHKQYSRGAEKRKHVFNIASQYHFIHALAMLGLPMCRRPYLASFFMLSGKILFCGTSYFYSMTGNSNYNILNPIGGTCFILGWLSMLL